MPGVGCDRPQVVGLERLYPQVICCTISICCATRTSTYIKYTTYLGGVVFIDFLSPSEILVLLLTCV